MAVKYFELTKKKITTRRKAPAADPVAFACDEDLLAVVAGWPWLPKAPALLLNQEDDAVFWVQVGGQRTDLVGISATGRLVAAEVLLDPFVGRKPSFRRLLRGLCRLDQHEDEPSRLAGPHRLDSRLALTAILVGDGAVFPKDNKQIKKIHKDFRQQIEDPGDFWPGETGAEREREDRTTPEWVAAQKGRPAELIVVAVTRFPGEKEPVIGIERLLQTTW